MSCTVQQLFSSKPENLCAVMVVVANLENSVVMVVLPGLQNSVVMGVVAGNL
jgi:hypothetical protein